MGCPDLAPYMAPQAMFILRLETFARVTDPKALNAVSTCVVAMVCLLWALLTATDVSQPVDQLAATSVARVAESLGRCPAVSHGK